MDDTLQQGIAALKAGDRDNARRMLMTAVKQTPDNERAWGWLYNSVDIDKERIECLRNIIRINPKNEKASQLLNELTVSDFPLELPSKTERIAEKKKPTRTLYIVTFLFCTPVWAILMITDGKQGAGVKTIAVIYLTLFIILCINLFFPGLLR